MNSLPMQIHALILATQGGDQTFLDQIDSSIKSGTQNEKKYCADVLLDKKGINIKIIFAKAAR